MTMKSSTKVLGRLPRTGICSQMGALCYRVDNGKLRVLLITSRRTGRWIVPKGWPMSDRDAAGTAAQEAWEEAGVIGNCRSHSLGHFFHFKVMSDGNEAPCLVEVFPIKVKRLAEKFPERSQRHRRWFSPKKAAARVTEPELAQMIRKFDPRILH
ncbi:MULTISPECIES: NUDIX hydrolase [Roseobacteraceae]|nr:MULTISPECIES: NUDIX hydrolase [Roseobacteraceae]